jgi:hypothetical protein
MDILWDAASPEKYQDSIHSQFSLEIPLIKFRHLIAFSLNPQSEKSIRIQRGYPARMYCSE